jgi:hypothetical protein
MNSCIIIKITVYFKDKKLKNKREIAINKAKSPTLFTNIAFIAALLAKILKYQKLINK